METAMSDKLSQLKKMTVVVADTGDINAIKKYEAQDATTNPSLILKAAEMEDYAYLIDEAIEWGKLQSGTKEEKVSLTLDKVIVNFGREILKIVPGYVSTEVDARLSFDTDATVKKAREIIAMYEKEGIDRSKVLIKIASTWEGIQAAKELLKDNIKCNLTLLFGFCQAVACAEAGVYLISPFVGRILDWYKRENGDIYTPKNDPGVLSVQRIYQYYKKFGYDTVVMGASFRNAGEIENLSGCDRITISPALLQELKDDSGELKQVLSPDMTFDADLTKVSYNEKAFRFELNEDAMATEKLSEGIRNFCKDIVKLEIMLAERL